MIRWLVLPVGFLLLSCASALKKQCEGTNWFQHGYNVAMSGKRLTGDQFSGQCEKEGVHPNANQLDVGFKAGMANYCKEEIVYATGKEGQFFSDDFCDPGMLRVLRAKHAQGVAEFCETDNGYAFGASGKTYNQICPKTQEKPFLVQYRKGRKVFLSNEISRREKQIVDLDGEIATLSSQRMRKNSELMFLEARPKRQEYVTKVNPDGSKSVEVKTVEDPDVESGKRNLQWDLNSLDRKIEDGRNDQKKMRTEIFDLKKEQGTLGE
ncbi:MAG: DUF2799 domain-containing protein [Bdellovibrionia bacterium]